MNVRSPRTALVVDDSAGARRRIRTVLRLGGWRVVDAVGATDALRQAAGLELDLVVTDMTMRDGSGTALLRTLRDEGCTARFLAVSSDVGAPVRRRAEAAGAGALLAKPVDPRLLLDFLLDRATGGEHPGVRHAADPSSPLRVDAERLDRVRHAYGTALPHRVTAVVSSLTEGNVAATASAARLLARLSDEAGHEGVARVCTAIAEDADRGMLNRARLTQLVALSAGAHPAVAALTGQATSR